LESHPIEIEFATIHCFTQLSQAIPVAFAPIILQPILDRLRRSPAIEYIHCLTPLMSVLSPDIVRHQLLESILELLKLSEAHQFAAGELLLLTPQLCGDSDFFAAILSVPIVVTHYLAKAIKIMPRSSNLTWFENALPKQMLPQANSFSQIRHGCFRALISVLDFADSQQIHLFLMTAFGWASNSENVALVIAENADILSAYHNGEFQAKVRDIALRVSKLTAISVRVRLCEIYAANPVFYLSSDAHFGRVYKGLAEDPEIDVRLSFIKSFQALYTRCQSVQLTDLLFSLFLSFFSSSDRRIHHALVNNPNSYLSLNASKINALLPGFLRICEGLVQWRLIVSAVAIFLNFPADCVSSSWRAMGAILKVKHVLSPFALSDAITTFYLKVFFVTQDEEVLVTPLSLARAPAHQFRSFFIKFAAIFGHVQPMGVFVDELWPAALALAQDPVLSVRYIFLRCAGQFHDDFVKGGLQADLKNLTTVFMMMGTIEDPTFEAAWRDVAAQLADERRSPRSTVQLYRSTTALDAPAVEVRRPLRRPELLRPVPTTDPSRKRNWVEPARRSLGGRPRL
jgi:hypothetical protein